MVTATGFLGLSAILEGLVPFRAWKLHEGGRMPPQNNLNSADESSRDNGIKGQMIGDSGHFNGAQTRSAGQPHRFIEACSNILLSVSPSIIAATGPHASLSMTRFYIVDAVVLGPMPSWLGLKSPSRCDW